MPRRQCVFFISLSLVWKGGHNDDLPIPFLIKFGSDAFLCVPLRGKRKKDRGVQAPFFIDLSEA